jgi:hypothetical protein
MAIKNFIVTKQQRSFAKVRFLFILYITSIMKEYFGSRGEYRKSKYKIMITALRLALSADNTYTVRALPSLFFKYTIESSVIAMKFE